MVASAAAHDSGLPPKVLPCWPGRHVITLLRAITAPSGMPEAMPFADVMMSGSTPKFSIAHHLPVRPMPDWTSSAMSMMPYLVHISRRRGKKLGVGTT